MLHRLADRAALAACLGADPGLHLYELGDLDDFFFGDCAYYGWADSGEVALVYGGSAPATLLALTRDVGGPMRRLVEALSHALPDRVYAHLSPGLAPVLATTFEFEGRGAHHKMMLVDPRRAVPLRAHDAERLGPDDEGALRVLYAASAGGEWFTPRMLQTGAYWGLRRAGELVAAAGVHVLSQARRTAALGNVATHPQHRGRGLAGGLCARLCFELAAGGVEHLGLNVASDNAAARACYRRIGFADVGTYDELLARRRAT